MLIFIQLLTNFFQNLPRFIARTKIINYLKDRDLLIAIRDHGMSIPLCSRTGDIIEPLPKSQWFMRYNTIHTYLNLSQPSEEKWSDHNFETFFYKIEKMSVPLSF